MSSKNDNCESVQSTSTTGISKEDRSLLEARLKSLTKPHQPTDIKFPQRFIGGTKRRFSATWFKPYPWIHYGEITDSACCFTCIRAIQTNSLSSSKQEEAFTNKGFNNWKKAMTKDGFSAHATTGAHNEATMRVVKAPVEYKNIESSMSEEHFLEQYNNRRMLLKILSNVRYLGGFFSFSLFVKPNFKQLLRYLYFAL